MRMGSDTPKQFMLLGSKPVIVHTIENFAGYDIVLVLPETQIQYWKALKRQYPSVAALDIKTVVGGDTRTESVRNGLAHVPDDTIVAIHDGVRPLVSKQLIDRCFASAEQYGSGVAATECTDSLREVDSQQTHAVDRSRYVLMQTPQTFRTNEIKHAYMSADASSATDDATIYEAAGYALHLVRGERSNIKITLPVDLKIASAILSAD